MRRAGVVALAALAAALVSVIGGAAAGEQGRPAGQSIGNFADRYEVNDTAEQARPIIDASPVISLTFCVSGTGSANDIDWYVFATNPGTILNVTAASTNLLLSARGFLADGATPAGSSADIIGASTVVITNTSAGVQQYLIRVSNNSGIHALYTLSYAIAPVPPPPVSGPAPDAWEPNDTIGEAGIITGGRPVASFILPETPLTALSFTPYTGRVSDGADWFMFYGRAGSIYELTTRDVRPGVETLLAVFEPDGVTLPPALPGSSNPNNRWIPGRRGSRVVFQAAMDGVYWARVTNLDPMPRTAEMTYTLALEELAVWPMRQVFVPGIRR